MFLVSDQIHAQQYKIQRERGWDQHEVNAWLTNLGSIPMRKGANQDCDEGITNRRDAILNGNRITTQIFNFGSISAPGNTITDIVWNGLGYGYEFGPLVAAEVVDTYREDGRPRDPQSVPLRDDNGAPVLDENGNQVYVMRIVSEGLVSNGGEVSPDGSTFWGWQPISCAEPVGNFDGIQVVNPLSRKIPTNDDRDSDLDGKPDSWPDDWYNESLEQYLWPGALRQGASNADKETLYFMNDYNNSEFSYWPFPSDSTKRGLGLEVEVRLYQWANPLAEDVIFLIYKITNKSEKDLEKVIFGMWGDPHVGGPNDWPDDWAFYDEKLNMVFAWDDDGRSDIAGRVPGYFGYKFLESPGVDDDGIDNDGDGYVDESWTDGIDNDGDWDPEIDDVGEDGIPGTGDFGEGDGVPTVGSQFDITKPGEPNFEFTDIDESDQFGLTSFASPPFAGNRVSNDERVWGFIQPGRFDVVPTSPGDYVFLYGSGSFRLRAGDTKRFSIALIVGQNRQDLRLNANISQQIYDVGYVFARPPRKPTLRAAAGDKRVTLYWDDVAESSVDPLTRERDFEGYVIYRSTDHEFSDQQTITDINGSSFLFAPLKNALGVDARFDLINGLSGPSPIPFPGRGVSYDLGDDTGLFHTFVDSNNVVNGQTYYYTVAAYDRGYAGDPDDALTQGIPPSETSKTITYDPTTDQYIFDVNTVAVVPGPKVAGYVSASAVDPSGITHENGHATGRILINVVDELAVQDNQPYRIQFSDSPEGVSYSVINEGPVIVTIPAAPGKSQTVGYTNIIENSVQVQTAGGRSLERDKEFSVNGRLGTINVFGGSGVGSGEDVQASFQYAPLFESRFLEGEEANIVFEGLHVFVYDDELEFDVEASGWVANSTQIPFQFRIASTGPGRIIQPYDYEIRFSDSPIGASFSNNLPIPFEVVNVTQANRKLEVFVPDANRNGQWNVNERIVFLEQIDNELTATWEVRLDDDSTTPGDGDVLFLATRKPFAQGDQFKFRTIAATTDSSLTVQELEDIYVVPNPYVATSVFEPRNPISRSQRGERRLYFANVPKQCTIRIYTLAGELVETLHHESALDDGKLFWDMRTVDNMNLAYGLYIFHVDSPEGSFIGKFAVIK
ncbi:MAG: hypothetical protein OXE59_07000 [Bacteroidetes bacterium]|nr:hypothetical protein [Bacteroidota bacterium]MCY4233469.1 hypothetical protein [Bacteroidota bacterium]